MAYYDVFNGDADGICALQQLRLEDPRQAQRISGLKRDINLLQQVDAAVGDEITVLDVSLDANRDALVEVLARGASVFYADHHYPGDIPDSELLDCHIDVAADTCTSLIINRILNNSQANWAVVGAPYADHATRGHTAMWFCRSDNGGQRIAAHRINCACPMAFQKWSICRVIYVDAA